MSEPIEFVRPEDMAVLREARLRAELALKEVEAIQLRIFVRYGLTERDTFDASSGKITFYRPEPTEQPESVG